MQILNIQLPLQTHTKYAHILFIEMLQVLVHMCIYKHKYIYIFFHFSNSLWTHYANNFEISFYLALFTENALALTWHLSFWLCHTPTQPPLPPAMSSPYSQRQPHFRFMHLFTLFFPNSSLIANIQQLQ